MRYHIYATPKPSLVTGVGLDSPQFPYVVETASLGYSFIGR